MSLPKYYEDRIEYEPMSGCWLWVGQVTPAGYGKAKNRSAHRSLYEIIKGPVADDLDLDHLCRVRSCVNPAHLEPVSTKENIRRGIRGVLTTHCPQGHPYDALNTRYFRGYRRCRECGRSFMRSYMRKRRAS